MNPPETRASLLRRIRDPSSRDAWTEFSEIYRPVVLQLAGTPPFAADGTFATLRQIIEVDPDVRAAVPRDTPAWLIHLIERLLSKDPEHRFARTAEVAQVLEVTLAHLRQPATVELPLMAKPRKQQIASRRVWIGFALLTAMSIVVLGCIGMLMMPPTSPVRMIDDAAASKAADMDDPFVDLERQMDNFENELRSIEDDLLRFQNSYPILPSINE